MTTIQSDEEYQAPAPTTEVYTRQNEHSQPRSLSIQLVGSHPLWAHHLWNASKVFASFFDSHPEICRDKYILELGAGGALPSLVAAANNAAKVVVTDYPDKELIDNIQYNVDTNRLGERILVEGYVWGTSTAGLRKKIPQATYDVIILSDLVFNHSQHHAMLRTCRELLTPKTGRVYVFYTHHRPHLAHRDVEFFNIAKRPYDASVDPDDRDAVGYGFEVDHFLQEKMNVMFEEDSGDVEVRSTVHGWQLWLP
ncbi:putative methyltransferase-domain-containing protein [Fennellomyces sp. T-0311]|nr:putative methyltransferase-domain-containing protein [Fennellomyces sp. T-0311]